MGKANEFVELCYYRNHVTSHVSDRVEGISVHCSGRDIPDLRRSDLDLDPTFLARPPCLAFNLLSLIEPAKRG